MLAGSSFPFYWESLSYCIVLIENANHEKLTKLIKYANRFPAISKKGAADGNKVNLFIFL